MVDGDHLTTGAVVLLRAPNSESGHIKNYRGGEKKTGGGEDVLCNDYFSTMRAATDKRSSPVERVDQVAKG